MTHVLSIVLTLFSLLLAPQDPPAKADFYISPDGKDTSAGTFDAPFKTLKRAKEAVRGLKEKTEDDILVLLRGGRYEFVETEVFGLDDSGSKTRSITYAAYPNEQPVLSGGTLVANWNQPTDEIPGLPTAAQGKVRVANVTESFHTLFDDQGIIPRASSKSFITLKGSSRDEVRIPEQQFKNWTNPTELEVVVRPHHAWIVNILPVGKLNAKKRSLTTTVESTYTMTPLHFLPDTPNCSIENAIEELDEPGEWVLNRQQKKLYYWPRNESDVYLPRLNEIIRVAGKTNIGGPKDQPVKNLCFRGLTFQHAERYTIQSKDAGLQHDWDFLDKDNAMLRLRGAQFCTVEDCHFLNSGSGAIRVDLHGIQNRIIGNHIEHLGGAGILLCGYGPGTKDVNHHNLVYNNHVHHVGEIYLHSPGIMVWQSGNNRVANNLVHHTNYTGVIISGCMFDFFKKGGRELGRTIRWNEIKGDKRSLKKPEDVIPYLHTHDNLIEANEIHHAMEKLGDGNAIYIRGAGPGNLICRNYVHDLVAPMIMQCAIRTDGGQRDTVISENIIFRCTSQGMMLKLNNRFENNIIADVIAPPRGYYLSIREGPLTGAVIQHNIFYSSGPVEDFINELAPKNAKKTEDRRGRSLARIQDADTDYNLYYSASNPEQADDMLKKQQSLGVGKHSIAADPQFADPANGDFSLPSNSPAVKLGFVPIDQSKIGLQPKQAER